MELQEIECALRAKTDALRAAESALLWRFYQGDPPMRGGAAEAYHPDYDDSSWPEVRLSHTWVGAAGDAWFRRSFCLPEYVQGIPTGGARIELPLFVLIHSEIYVDGVQRIAEPSWLDTRAVPVELCESYSPGQTIQVTVHGHQGDGFGIFIAERAEVSSLEETIFRLEVLRNQFAFTHYLAYEGPRAHADWQADWQRATLYLDFQALAENRWGAWWQSAEMARSFLVSMATEAKTYTTHLVGHSHIDMNWLWTWDETVDVIRRDFIAADALMERYPGFHFSQSQAATYRAMEERHPDVLERAKRRVAGGNWEVTASTWVEADLNLECGESLVRHFLLTRPYIERLFGLRPRICWEPDTFGHVATLPQLLQQVGIDSYYFCRAGQGQPLFWWEGLDGSRVLAFNDALGYGGVVDPTATTWPALDLAKRYGLKRGLYVYGVGDHGGGATARDIVQAGVLQTTPLLPHAEMTELSCFYDECRAAGAELPVVHGELNTTFEGCYTTHGDIKMLNRRGENGLLSAESLATLASALAGAAYPAEALTESWRTLLFHQFHDILCGCAIGATYREAAARLQPVLEAADAATASAAAQLSARVDTGDGHIAGSAPIAGSVPIASDVLIAVVWNPLAWTRTDPLRLPLKAFGAIPSALVDDAGQVLPVQVVGEELLFIARDVPALGCRVYRPSAEAAQSDLAVAEEGTVQNAILSFHVHPASGALDSLVDLEAGRTVDVGSHASGPERKENGGFLNRLQILYEEPHSMSAWTIGDITRVESLLYGAEVQVIERGPVRAAVEVRRKMLHSSITQRYCLYAGMRRLDIETDLDWHERGGKDVDAPMLRAIFRPAMGSSAATFEVPFAGLQRPAVGDEVPALRWADISDDQYGLSLLNNGKYGHQAHGATLGLTLVRAPYEPDNLPDQGRQSFTYALYPHPGDWRQAATDRRGAEFNQPLVATMTGTHPGDLAPNRALLSCEPANIMVTAVKAAESAEPEEPDEKAVIVRLVEMQGREAQAHLRWAWPVQRVQEVSPIEEPLRDLAFEPYGCDLSLGAHKVVTLKLTPA